MGFQQAGAKLTAEMMAGLDAFGEMIMAESLRQCPVETGTLKRSGKVGNLQRGGNVTGEAGKIVAHSGYSGDGHVIIGYGFGDEVNPKTNRLASEYAVPVHEIVEVYHEPPTKAKFLEDPVFEHAPLMEPLLASYMRLEGATPVVAAFIEGNANLVEEEAGAKPPMALDEGDHPLGTPHD